MRRWHARHNVELLIAMIVLVGGTLCGVVWLRQYLKMPSFAPTKIAQRATGPENAPAVLAAPLPANVPRACAEAMRAVAANHPGTTRHPDARDSEGLLAGLDLAVPVMGVDRAALRDSFLDARGMRKHEAIDIHAPRGTAVIAADDGCVVKLFRSAPGGITLYQFDPVGNFAYYYAHMDRYADNVTEGTLLRRGDVVGYVGTTGNAPPSAPHLHFAIYRLGPEKRWWAGTPVNPYAVFTSP